MIKMVLTRMEWSFQERKQIRIVIIILSEMMRKITIRRVSLILRMKKEKPRWKRVKKKSTMLLNKKKMLKKRKIKKKMMTIETKRIDQTLSQVLRTI